MARQGIPAGVRNLKAGIEIHEILIVALDLGVCVFNQLSKIFREVDKTRGTRKANTILFKGNL